MSDAMNYLLKARPDAMGAYFKFLKGAGTHLDPKTRDLISVITKVDVQTENGLKQYLSRALRNGCTPNEIIDALLMAFPTLGLAKIIWAVDIILAMDISDFAIDALNETTEWHDLGALDGFADGQATYIKIDYRSLFVFRKGETIRVYDSTCPHQVTNIPELAICENHLTCPKHAWKFDLETGDCIEKGNHPLKSFEARVENGVVQAWW
ncbi:MAG: Rieske 2Fe-2S domain-containing protein [Proteobacteria bacterium]|jgi:nitrite reductase/ring-hydroxylating ferredoxin subunit/alkylhydroperoxidase/carboxymuconolactone decarboxylase family protein YurZ|nr:Rieske 2Fe-2S domain-containing protein [Pseudomonadota bacterium]MDA1285482.1 Rieske 2Fe-2S domain-containing protein [Pseudomonadota bacterium]NQW12948.1 Rieske 2Fe-2S domain-containing protein [Rhodobacter sp.]